MQIKTFSKIVGALAYLFGKVKASEDSGHVVVVAFWLGKYWVLAETHLTKHALRRAKVGRKNVSSKSKVVVKPARGYSYLAEKPKLFTEDGQRDFLKVRDRAHKLLAEAGAFMMFSALEDISGDTWVMMAHVDRLVELGEIREITNGNVAGQHRVFVAA